MSAQPGEYPARPDDPVVIDSATGDWLPGVPTQALVEAHRGHAWQMAEGIWRLADPEDDEEAVYRAVVVRPARHVCIAPGCRRSRPWVPPGETYECAAHISGVDKSTEAEVVSSQTAIAPEPTRAATPGRREPDMAAPRNARERMKTGRTIVRDGITAILAGETTADAVLAEVAEVIPEVAEPTPAKTKRERRQSPMAHVPTGEAAKVAAAVDAAEAAAEADPFAGRVLITLVERDRLLSGKPSAGVKAMVADGLYVRPDGRGPRGGQVRKHSEVASPDPKFYPRWRLAIDAAAASGDFDSPIANGVETVAATAFGWSNPDGKAPREPRTVTVRESAPRAPRLPSPEAVERSARSRKARETVAATESLGGSEYLAAVASDEVQGALETIASDRREGDDD